MSEREQQEKLAARLRRLARGFPYPPTPNLAILAGKHPRPRGVSRPFWKTQWAWVILILAVALSGLASVPPVRAQVLEILRLGAVRIFAPGSTAALTPEPALDDEAGSLVDTLNLSGETTLEQAAAQAGFPILLPAYPEDLGPPDKVYIQDLGDVAVILVWLDPEDSSQVLLSLYELGPNAFLGKGAPEILVETSVHGQRAIWLTGDHPLLMVDGSLTPVQLLVSASVLVWEQSGITFRLESRLTLEEAIRMAESLN